METEYRGNPGCAVPEEAEIDDLCRTASRYFREPVTREAVRFAHCSVRPLYNGASRTQQTRDGVLDLRGTDGTTPILSVIGREIITYRRLAEQALAKLAPFLRLGPS